MLNYLTLEGVNKAKAGGWNTNLYLSPIVFIVH